MNSESVVITLNVICTKLEVFANIGVINILTHTWIEITKSWNKDNEYVGTYLVSILVAELEHSSLDIPIFEI